MSVNDKVNARLRNLNIRKIADLPEVCMDDEHEPPRYMVLQPGIYEHTCPACGEVQRFTVQRAGTRMVLKGTGLPVRIGDPSDTSGVSDAWVANTLGPLPKEKD